MADTALILGVTGVLTSGVIGPAVANRFAAARQRREFSHQRAMADREGLRELLDTATVALHTASYAQADARSAIMIHGKHLNEGAPKIGGQMSTAGEPLDALRERIFVRLGRDHPVAISFRETTESFLQLYRPVMLLWNGQEADIKLIDTVREIDAAAGQFEKRRISFVDEVGVTVGVRLDDPEPAFRRALKKRRR